MGLETGSVIADLVVTNPTGSDAKSAGDDHFRLVKTVVRQCFAGFPGAVLVTGTDGGAADVYTLTPTTALLAYANKMLVEFTPNATSATTTPTLNISALGAKTIISQAGAALLAADLVSGRTYLAAYDGTYFRLISVTTAYVDAVRDYATALAFSSALPSISGATADFVVTNDGATGSWTDKLKATVIKFKDGTDATKLMAFSLSGITTATTRTVTIPDKSGTMAMTSDIITIFSVAYLSSDQTITAAGTLTLAHSLGAIPKVVQGFLKCTTGEAGYSTGDVICIHFGSEEPSSVSRGVSVVADSTNLVVRFGSTATTFSYLNKTTGSSATLTNAKWTFHLRAFV